MLFQKAASQTDWHPSDGSKEVRTNDNAGTPCYSHNWHPKGSYFAFKDRRGCLEYPENSRFIKDMDRILEMHHDDEIDLPRDRNTDTSAGPGQRFANY